MPTVWVVDVSHDSLALIQQALAGHYLVTVAQSGANGLEIASAETPPDLILLGVSRPEMNGHEVCRQLKTNAATSPIPVIVLVEKPQADEDKAPVDMGAQDYITQPVYPAAVLARVRTQLRLAAVEAALRQQNLAANDELARRTRDATATQDAVMLAMASLAETRDSDTGNHLRRTQRYVKALAWKLSTHPRFAPVLSLKVIGLLYKAAPLHDIGKVGIPDRILLKPGKLTPEEFEIMKTHTTLGRDALLHAEQELGVEVEFLSLAKEITYSHQEKWDGSGYPQGLAGDQIPVSARLMALADVYDALISRRVYKEPMSHEQAAQIIEQTRAKHFDPDVVDAFLALQENFRAIAMAYSDSESDIRKKTDYIQIAQI